jgi:hypothetical protein
MPEMPHDELRNAAHAIVARLQSEFDAHLNRLDQLHDEAREDARRQAEARAAEEWNAKLDAERADWQRRMDEAASAAAAELDRRATALAEARAELERHNTALAQAHAEAERRVAAEAARVRSEAEQAATVSAERLREELEQRALEATSRVRAEMQQVAAESTSRLRAEMEATAAETVARLKEDMERGLAAERERAGNEINAERARMHAELTAERDRMAAEIENERLKAQALSTSLEEARLAVTVAETELRTARGAQDELRATLAQEREAARAAAAAVQQSTDEEAITNARAAERQSQLAFVERLLSAVQAIGTARSLSDTLTTLTSAAASLAPRVALFVVNDRGEASGGREFQSWRAAGFGDRPLTSMHLGADNGGVVAAAASLRRPVTTATVVAPTFAGLRGDRAALGVPIIVGGKSVAVLYADDGAEQEPEAPASWPEAMQILGAHASAWLTQITAVRTTQAMRATGGRLRDAGGSGEDDSSARRYARLLVSEIKLYNEAAVRSGREKRDLLQRLRPEIERARRLYEERVPPSIGARAVYFQDELVHTLADGDATLLGSA